MLGEMLLLLHNVILQVDKDDSWIWTLESSNVFSVRSAYRFLTEHPVVDSQVIVSDLWHKDIPLKVVYLLGGYSVTGCLLRTICIIMVFFIVFQHFVWRVVMQLNHLNTYFYIVILLGQFGTLFIAGLASLRLCQLKCRLTLISSALVVELQRSAAQSLRSYGLRRFEKFGKKEITGYLIIKHARLYRWLIRLSLSLLGG